MTLGQYDEVVGIHEFELSGEDVIVSFELEQGPAHVHFGDINVVYELALFGGVCPGFEIGQGPRGGDAEDAGVLLEQGRIGAVSSPGVEDAMAPYEVVYLLYPAFYFLRLDALEAGAFFNYLREVFKCVFLIFIKVRLVEPVIEQASQAVTDAELKAGLIGGNHPAVPVEDSASEGL
jgi:hypothetical protein